MNPNEFLTGKYQKEEGL